MPPMPLRWLVSLVLVLPAAAGCGASQQQQVQSTLRADRAAWDRGDYEKACALRTEAGRREWSRLGAASTCAEGIRRVVDPPVADLSNVVVATIAVQRSTARSRIRVDGDEAVIYRGGFSVERLRKVDGQWLIDAAP
jgi:hypothetical protein